MEKLWTTAEVAQCLGITEADVEALVRQGTLTGYQLGGRFLRFRPDQVEAIKGTIEFRPPFGKRVIPRQDSWLRRAQEFLYFNDFYVITGALLAGLVVYLIAS